MSWDYCTLWSEYSYVRSMHVYQYGVRRDAITASVTRYCSAIIL